MQARPWAYVIGVTAVLSTAGCSTMPHASRAKPQEPEEPPALTLRYSTGRALQDFRFPLSVVEDASKEALQDLKFEIRRVSQDGVAAQIEARTADNRAIMLTFRPQSPVTRVSCRIGWFGDEPLTRTLMRRIEVRLGTLPPEPIPDKLPSKPAPNPYLSRDAIPDSEMMKDMVEAPYRNRPDM